MKAWLVWQVRVFATKETKGPPPIMRVLDLPGQGGYALFPGPAWGALPRQVRVGCVAAQDQGASSVCMTEHADTGKARAADSAGKDACPRFLEDCASQSMFLSMLCQGYRPTTSVMIPPSVAALLGRHVSTPDTLERMACQACNGQAYQAPLLPRSPVSTDAL